MAQKIIYCLLIALVLSLGFGQLLRFDFFGVPLYLHDVLTVCILALQLPRTFLDRRPEQSSSRDTEGGRRVLMGTLGIKLILAGLFLGSLHALTIYPVSDLLVPSLYSLRILAYLGLYFVIKSQKNTIPLSVFLCSGLVTLTIGLLQYFLLPDMRIFQYLGWDDHLSRLTLPHFDPTFTGVMLSLALLSIFPSISSLLSPLFFLAILLTYSRSTWIALFLTGLLSIKNRKIFLASSIFLLISIFALPQKFGEGTNLLRTYSINSRFESDLAYIQKYKWDLLIGRGMNTLILDSGPSKYDNHATGPNNSYLYLLSTTGILGLAGWGMVMYSLYVKSIHKPMLIFFFLASLFNNVMFYPFALLWVLLLESPSHT